MVPINWVAGRSRRDSPSAGALSAARQTGDRGRSHQSRRGSWVTALCSHLARLVEASLTTSSDEVLCAGTALRRPRRAADSDIVSSSRGHGCGEDVHTRVRIWGPGISHCAQGCLARALERVVDTPRGYGLRSVRRRWHYCRPRPLPPDTALSDATAGAAGGRRPGDGPARRAPTGPDPRGVRGGFRQIGARRCANRGQGVRERS
jgi:hypothetical protein